MAINPLDNPVWHALTGPHRAHAIGHGKAAHYPRDMAPFSAICEASDEAYADLARDLAPDTEARLFRPAEEALPAGWRQIDAFPMLQMVAASAPDPVDASIETLSRADVPAMMDLVAIAKPGPFGPRSIELRPLSRHQARRAPRRDGRRAIAAAGACRAERHLRPSRRARTGPRSASHAGAQFKGLWWDSHDLGIVTRDPRYGIRGLNL